MNKQTERAYLLALEELAIACGTCPYEAYGFDCDCESRCDADDTVLAGCWKAYFDVKAIEEVGTGRECELGE